MSLKLAAFLAVLLVSAPAIAADPPDREQCATSYEKAQRARQAHQLKASRAELLVCSRNECQAWIKKDCVTWLGQVEATMPSIVVTARGTDGKPQNDVRVTIDGELHSVTEPIALDPGEHKLVVDAPGLAKIEQTFTLKEGERDRKLELTLTPGAAPAPPPPPPEEPKPQPVETRPVPTLTWILGAAGIAGGVVGTVFQVSGMSKTSDLGTCSPHCPSTQIDTARSTLWTGNIVLGVAAVALVSAVVVYVLRPTVYEPK